MLETISTTGGFSNFIANNASAKRLKKITMISLKKAGKIAWVFISVNAFFTLSSLKAAKHISNLSNKLRKS